MKRPDLNDIYSRVRADIGSGFRFSLRKIFSQVLAGTAHMLYGYIDYMAEATMPDSSVTEILNRWCILFNISRNTAQYAEIRIQVTAGEVLTLPGGTSWRHESGLIYTLSDPVEISVPAEDNQFFAECTVICGTSGDAGNRRRPDILTVTATIPHLNAEAEVVDISRTGADEESDWSLRNRLVARLRKPPQGGCSYDYIAWTLANPGVSRAWVLPRPRRRRGDVRVTCLMASGLPSAEEDQVIQEKILEICPVTANLSVVPPEKKELVLTLKIVPDNDETLEEIRQSLITLLDKKAAPKGYFSADDILTPETGIIFKSDIHQAISSSPGETSHEIVSIEGNIPDQTGQIVVLGRVIRAV